MNRYTFHTKTATLSRLTKGEALKAWEAGDTIGFCPIKLSPVAFDGAFLMGVSKATAGDKCVADPQFGVLIVNHKGETLYDYGHLPRTFDDVLSSFQVYNCNSNETGYATSFWSIVPHDQAVTA